MDSCASLENLIEEEAGRQKVCSIVCLWPGTICARCVCARALGLCVVSKHSGKESCLFAHTLTATWFDQRGHLVRKRHPPRKHTHAHAVRLTPRVADGASTYTRTITHESHEPGSPATRCRHHSITKHTHTHTHTHHTTKHTHTRITARHPPDEQPRRY